MNNFREALDGLFLFLERAGEIPPTQTVSVVEISPTTRVDGRGRVHVRRDEFRDPSNYESRFQELLSSGLPWLNVGCYGVYEQRLVVVVEVPAVASRQATRTSVNYS